MDGRDRQPRGPGPAVGLRESDEPRTWFGSRLDHLRRLVRERHPVVLAVTAVLLVVSTAVIVLTVDRVTVPAAPAARPDLSTDAAGPSDAASASPDVEASPTPDPTPTAQRQPGPQPVAVGQSRCVARPSSCGLPDASNTGVPAGISLTTVGNLDIDTPGAVIENMNVRGCVSVSAGGVTIRNSRIASGNCNTVISTSGAADGSSVERLTIVDSEISCENTPHTGIADNNFTLLRVEISGCENGMDVDNHVTVQDSYIHDLVTCCDAHTDGAQLNAKGTDIAFIHNSIISAAPGGTSAIIMHTEAGNSHVLVQNNLLAGGAYILYCPRVPTVDIRVIGNRFGPAGEGSGGAAFGAQDHCSGIAEFAGNVWDATGQPVTT